MRATPRASRFLPSVGALNAEPKTGPYSGLDLRPAILKVLKERGPMRAPDIAEVLAEGGFINASTTPLGTRVYNDLWRQSQKHQVKLDMGVFSLP